MQGSPAEVQAYRQLLQDCINEKGLQTFYPQGSPVIDQIAQQAAGKINQVIQRWRVQKEIANDIVKLALYDIVLYIDDSGSMQFEEEGSRIKDLRLILERVSFAATLFDADGISLRFMNTDLSTARDQQGRPLQDGVASEAQIEQIMRGVQFKGLTPMGTSLRKKVIDEIVLGKAQQGQLRKPVLVIAITDGQPAGEPQNAVFDTIRYAFDTLQQRFPQYGRGGVAFEFAQVGNDEMAKKFLSKLDEDPQIGPMVDCTSSKYPSSKSALNATLTRDKTTKTNRRKCPAPTRPWTSPPTSGSSSFSSAQSTARTTPRTRRQTPRPATSAHPAATARPKADSTALPRASTAHLPRANSSTASLPRANMAPLPASSSTASSSSPAATPHKVVSTPASSSRGLPRAVRLVGIPVSSSMADRRRGTRAVLVAEC